MELIDKNKIDFTTIEPYECSSVEMEVVFKEDIERLPEVKAIPLDKVKKARKEIENLRLHKAQFITSDAKVCIDSLAVLEIIDKLIEYYEREEQ